MKKSSRRPDRIRRRYRLRIAAAIVVTAIVLWGLWEFGNPRIAGDDGEIVMVAAGLFGGGIYAFLSGFSYLHRRHLIVNTPTAKVRSLSLGVAEVFGEVVQDDTVLKSPFSGEDCVAYKYEVEEYRQQGKSKSWVTIDEGRRGTNFLVDDGTGQVTVDPRGAWLRIPDENTITVDGGVTPPEPIQQFIDANARVGPEDKNLDLKLFKLPMGNKRRYTEQFVRTGDEVYVFGKALSMPGVSSSVNAENIVISRDRSTPLFMISDRDEDELVGSFGRKALVRVGGGIALILSGLWSFLWIFQLL